MTQSASANPFENRGRDPADSGEIGQHSPIGTLTKPEPHIQFRITRRDESFQMNGGFPGTAKASTVNPDWRPSAHSRASSTPSLSVRRGHLTGKTLQGSIQDIAVGESATHRLSRVDHKSMILSERKEPQTVIQVPVGQKDRLDWCSA